MFAHLVLRLIVSRLLLSKIMINFGNLPRSFIEINFFQIHLNDTFSGRCVGLTFDKWKSRFKTNLPVVVCYLCKLSESFKYSSAFCCQKFFFHLPVLENLNFHLFLEFHFQTDGFAKFDKQTKGNLMCVFSKEIHLIKSISFSIVRIDF